MTAASRILVVDDNAAFRRALGTALSRRGMQVDLAANAEGALALAQARPADRAVIDLNLGSSSGLSLIPELLAIHPGIKIVMLTGYASIATAVEAIRLGAVQYLAKPAEVGAILAAFDHHAGRRVAALPAAPMSLAQLEWEHLQGALLSHGGNVSATARSLGLHRRSLQRKLQKHACW